MPNSKRKSIHAQRLKAIRPYVSFKYKLSELTPYQKRKIKKYYEYIDELSARNHVIYKSRSKNNIQIAKDYSGQVGFNEVKVAFVPVADAENPPEIRIKNGQLEIITDHIHTTAIFFDPFLLQADPEEHARQLLSDQPDNARYTVICGVNEIPQGRSRGTMPAKISELVERYSDSDKNNYFQNWLFGMRRHTFTEQADYQDYQTAKLQARNKLRKERQRRKRARR